MQGTKKTLPACLMKNLQLDSMSRMQSTCLVLDIESRADKIKTAVRFNERPLNQIVDEEEGLLYTWEK